MFKAALFDMDGVIVNNRDAHLEAFKIFTERYGAVHDDKNILAHFGRTNREIMASIFGPGLSDEQIYAYSREKEEIYRELYDPVMVPTRGLVELLDALRAAGIRTAVGSSAGRTNVDFVLKNCGIAEKFDAIACGSDIKRGKPDPEVYLLAAERVGTAPGDCVVFEDAFVGIEAARSAGMHVVALATTFPQECFADTDCDRVIDDFTGIGIAELREVGALPIPKK